MRKRTRIALVAGAVALGVTGTGGWFGYQVWSARIYAGCVLRGYDVRDPADTAPRADDVFTGTVTSFEGRRRIDEFVEDVYLVEVSAVLRGDLRGTVRVTHGHDNGPAPRLEEGATYVFATAAWEDVEEDGNAQLYQGEMLPVDDAQLALWRKVAALPRVTE
ncbi:hypothetical protein AB0G79_13820 [Streptomyces sp. NPDC020807]|uniref:hypothetical protein n=1 Tax=Streptomyces sp. NPDC020807 TaxID=3155119 RepID=UPI0033FC72A8